MTEDDLASLKGEVKQNITTSNNLLPVVIKSASGDTVEQIKLL